MVHSMKPTEPIVKWTLWLSRCISYWRMGMCQSAMGHVSLPEGFRWGLTWKPKVVDSMSAWQSMTAAFPRSSGATLKECWRALTRLQREACVAAAACLIYLPYFNIHPTWWKFHPTYQAKMSMIAYIAHATHHLLGSMMRGYIIYKILAWF